MFYCTDSEGNIVDVGIQVQPTDKGHSISFHNGEETIVTVEYTGDVQMSSAEWVAWEIENRFIIAEPKLKAKGYS